MSVSIVIGASIISHLANLLSHKGIKVIARPGLSFSSKKMESVQTEFKRFCMNKTDIKVALYPLGNSMFSGIPRGQCYLKPRMRALTAKVMAEKTTKLIKTLRTLVPTEAKISFTILPGLGRRPKPCQKGCKKCICYGKYPKRLLKFENHMKKVKNKNANMISIT